MYRHQKEDHLYKAPKMPETAPPKAKEMPRKFAFVVNPEAGPKDFSEKAREMQEAASSVLGTKPGFCVTSDRGDAENFAKALAQAAFTNSEEIVIFAVGGDGTLNEVLNGVMKSQCEDNVIIAHVPVGSGNDFIKSFPDAGDFMDVAGIITGERGFETQKVDVLTINDRYAFNIVSTGLDARVAADIGKYRRNSFVPNRLAYPLSALLNVLWGTSQFMRISLYYGDCHNNYRIDLDQKVTMITICNGGYYGGKYHAMPGAKVDDGTMQVLVVPELTRLQIGSMIKKYEKGKYEELGIPKYSPYAIRVKTKYGNEKLTVNIDGELMETDEIKVQLIPSGVRFLVPNS